MQDSISIHEAVTAPQTPVSEEVVSQAPETSAAVSAVKAHAPAKAAPKKEYQVPQFLQRPEGRQKPEATEASLAADSVAAPADSGAVDTIVAGEVKEGIILVNPAGKYLGEPAQEQSRWQGGGMSWIYLAFALLFCVVGIRFKNSPRYLKALLSDLTDTRLRHNAFDDTVNETSLLLLLNLMWAACAGVMLWEAITIRVGDLPWNSIGIPDRPAAGAALCMGVAAIYLVCMTIAYWAVGNVFSESRQTILWVKGAAASTGLQTGILFPTALLALIFPAWAPTLLIIALCTFAIGKIIFLFKGFRIFFAEISSWMLFLYYLCSLEIVPLILTYLGAVALCSALL